MTLIGTVDRLKQRGLYAFIRVDSQEFFAHKSEFLQPELMKEGQRVKFTPAPTHRGLQAFHIEAA